LEKINKMMWLLDYEEEDPDDLPLDDDALKTLFFQMMPQTWQLNFGAIDLEITDDNISFAHVICFMKKKEKADKLRSKSAPKQKPSREDELGPYTGKCARARGGCFGCQGGQQYSQGDNSNESSNENGRESHDNTRGGRGEDRGQGRGGRGGRGHSGNCPFPGHRGHDWADCFGNPKSDNYKPNFQLHPEGHPNGSNNNNAGGNNRRENEDAHVNDESTAANANNNNGAFHRNGAAHHNAQRGTSEVHWLDDDIFQED